MAFASWWYATQCDKKTAGAPKTADKKVPETTEKKYGSASASARASASTSAAGPAAAEATASSKVPEKTQEKTMKPADPKARAAPKVEPPKSAQTTKPKSTTTTSSSSTTKPSTAKGPTKQDAKSVPGKQKADPTIAAAAAGKVAATSVVSSVKPKDDVKEKKTVSVANIAAAAAPVKSEKDDALDLLIDSLGGPDTVPESPKFTGPEIADTPATSEYVEELGKRDDTIPPEYRHLLDGKGEKPAAPAPEETMGDDDLVAAMSSDFVSCQAPPEEKKPKLEEKKEVKPASTAVPAAVATQPSSTRKEVKPTSVAPVPASTTQPASTAISDDAIDELLGTLEAPPVNIPESPVYTGPEVTETITSTYLEELGKRESSIPPEYRHLLDGKEDGKPVPPPAEEPKPTSDLDLVDEFSKDFDSCLSPAVQPAPDVKPKDSAQDKKAKAEMVVPASVSSVQAAAAPASVSSVQAAAAPSAGMDDALDELMGTLEGPEFSAPESPMFTGPEVTETATSTYIEELGKREGSIPPAYRHLLDGKDDGKPAPLPHPEEVPMSESDLLDEFDKDFACSKCPPVQSTPDVKPKDDVVIKPESDIVVSTSRSAVQAAPAPSKVPAAKVPAAKVPAPKADPLDALAGTLGVRQEDPKGKKPAADRVKEKTGKENREKLGEDEETIPPEYRLKEVKDKDGKPILPKPEVKPQAMSEDDLLDALTEGFVASPAASQCAPLQSPKKPGKSGSEETISCSKVSAVQSSAPAPKASTVQIPPDDALDQLSGSLGTRQADPDENKPAVDVVKEKAKEEHIDKLGDRDDTIPPEYRHLLDGKDQGEPAKPQDVKPPPKPLGDDAAIDALSSGFSSCDTGSTDKAQNSAKDKTGKSCSTAPVSQPSGKVPDTSKSTSPASSAKPSAPKTGRS